MTARGAAAALLGRRDWQGAPQGGRHPFDSLPLRLPRSRNNGQCTCTSGSAPRLLPNHHCVHESPRSGAEPLWLCPRPLPRPSPIRGVCACGRPRNRITVGSESSDSMESRRLALVALFAAFGCASAALLQRPEQDCINPSVEKVNQFNFFPEDTRSIIAEPTPAMPGAQVRGVARQHCDSCRGSSSGGGHAAAICGGWQHLAWQLRLQVAQCSRRHVARAADQRGSWRARAALAPAGPHVAPHPAPSPNPPLPPKGHRRGRL